MNGWMDGWVGRWLSVQIGRKVKDGWIDEWMDGSVGEWMVGEGVGKCVDG